MPGAGNWGRAALAGLFCLVSRFDPGMAAEPSQEVLLDPCDALPGWELDTGREFPGARGALALAESEGRACLRLDYDFSRGGNYLGATREGDIPESAALGFQVQASNPQRGMVRVRDATGQEFLGGFKLEGQGWTGVRLPFTGQGFPRHWGGANDGKLHWPLRKLLIAANAPGSGQLLLRNVTLDTGDAGARWQVKVLASQPGHIAFAEEAPPVAAVTALHAAAAPADVEVRCAITRDDGRKVVESSQRSRFGSWERRDWQWTLPTSEPGHYRVQVEVVSGPEVLARAEGGLGVVLRPVRLGEDDPQSFFGLHVNDPAAAARIGVKWTRVFRQWWWVESLKGHCWWPDELSVDGARRQGLRVLLTLDAWPPGWAKKECLREGEPVWPFPPPLLAAYERYVREAARQYRDKVDVFEIQNEPDLSCWRHENLPFEAGMESFVRLARAAAPIVRQEAPGIRLAGIDVSGGDYDYGLSFSRAALEKVGGLFDIYSGHPYASPRYFGEGLRPLFPLENREAEKLQDSLAMLARAGGRQRLWVGEKGWGLDVREPSHGEHSLAYADCLAQALITGRSVPGVERYFWFLQQGANEGGYEYGLWRGRPSQPLPAAVAYATVARFLDHVEPRGVLSLRAGLKGFCFESQEASRGVVALWAEEEACDLAASWPEGTRATGLLGRSCSLAPLRVARSPVFLTVPSSRLTALREALEKQAPVPVEAVRIENAWLVSTRQLAARVQNRQSRELALTLQLGGAASQPQPIPAAQTALVLFDVPGGVRRLGWKTVPAEFWDQGRLVTTRPLVLNLRHCPRLESPFAQEPSEWGKPSTKVLDRWQVLPPDPTVGWNGPEDLSAEVWWGFDQTFFHFAARVTDDVHCARSGDPSGAWQEDSLALAFDGGNDAGDAAGYDGNDTEILCEAADSGCRVFVTQPATAPARMASFARRQGTTTLYTLAIPWDLLRLKPEPGRMLGFNFVINDNDGAGRAYWMGARPGIIGVKHPGQFLDLFLEER